MRNAQFPFSQAQMALFEKDASLAEKFKFRGICFILSLRWLDLRNQGKGNADSILGLKDQGRFLALWKEFDVQSQTARQVKQFIQEEIDLARSESRGYKEAIANVTSAGGMDPNTLRDVLTDLQEKRQNRLERKRKGQDQLARMFASERDQILGNGEVGTPSEQLLRRMFSMDIKMVNVADLTVKSKSFFGNTMSWVEAGQQVEQFISGMATSGPSMFEIGFYGSGAHSVAAFADDTGAYSFFDPNYGVFVGDGTLNKLDVDVANLLKDKYSKMNKVVVTYLGSA